MASKVTLENFASEIEKIMKEYGDEVEQNLSTITKKVGQKGAKLLRDQSLEKFPDSKKHKSRYGQTWTAKTEQRRLYTTVTIYNRQAGLPHLLENGHLSSNGTHRIFNTDKAPVKGIEHIAEVEQKLIKEFESEVVTKL